MVRKQVHFILIFALHAKIRLKVTSSLMSWLNLPPSQKKMIRFYCKCDHVVVRLEQDHTALHTLANSLKNVQYSLCTQGSIEFRDFSTENKLNENLETPAVYIDKY